jgi:hypothetical protein
MAKNKIFLTVLVVFLASCAVLLGCAGEGADGVSKSVDNGMSVSDNSGGEIPFEPVEVGGTGEGELPGPKEEDVPLPPWEIGTFPGLDVETEMRIYQGLWNPTYATYTRIEGYYGTYNNVVAIELNTGGWAALCKQIVAEDIVFVWSQSGHSIRAWKEGLFYNLQKAYDLGLLTREDIQKINGLHRAGYPRLYDYENSISNYLPWGN